METRQNAAKSSSPHEAICCGEWAKGCNRGDPNKPQFPAVTVFIASSLRTVSAINGQWHSSDPFGIVAGQEYRWSGEVVDLA